MKTILLIISLLISIFFVMIIAFNTKDHDILILLKDKIFIKKQIKCLLRKGNCDYFGREMKRKSY